MSEYQPSEVSRGKIIKEMLPPLLMTLMVGYVTVFLSTLVIRNFFRCIDAQTRFKTTTGQIIESRIERQYSGGDDGTYEHKLIIEYSYNVNGQKHQASRYCYGYTGNYRMSKRIVSRYPKGRQITVYYDPDSPATAVLNPEITDFTYVSLLLIQPFLTGSLWLLVCTLSTPKRTIQLADFLRSSMQPPWKIPSWGKLTPDMDGTLFIKQRENPWRAGGIVYGSLCAVISAVVGQFVLFADDDIKAIDFHTFLMALGIAFLLGLIAAFRARTKFRNLLEIEKDFHRIRLTTKTCKEAFHFSDIAQWTTQKILARVDKDNKPIMAPLLSAVTTEGQSIAIHLFRSGEEGEKISQKVAHEFANLTAKPVESLDPQLLPDPPKGRKKRSAYIKELRAMARRYRDVS